MFCVIVKSARRIARNELSESDRSRLRSPATETPSIAVFHHKWFLIDFFVSDTEGKKCDIALEKGKEASHQIQISAVMTCDHWSDQQAAAP